MKHIDTTQRQPAPGVSLLCAEAATVVPTSKGTGFSHLSSRVFWVSSEQDQYSKRVSKLVPSPCDAGRGESWRWGLPWPVLSLMQVVLPLSPCPCIATEHTLRLTTISVVQVSTPCTATFAGYARDVTALLCWLCFKTSGLCRISFHSLYDFQKWGGLLYCLRVVEGSSIKMLFL